jgi:hypothetical protein
MNYSVTEIGDGNLIVLCNGAEMGTAPTIRKAAAMCADDIIESYPEATPDIAYDVVANCGQQLGNVIHMRWYRNELIDWLAAELRPETTKF